LSTGLEISVPISQYPAQFHRDPMTPSREIELKLEVPEQALARLTRSPLLQKARDRTRRPTYLVSVYYDTDTLKLRKHGLTLRVRRIGRRYVQTVKQESDASSALMDRCEWKHDIAGRKPNLALARDTGLDSILSKKLQPRLKPLFETRVRRMVYLIRGRGSEIELTIDKGTIAAGRQSSPICEVELELKRGDAAELFKVARTLARQVPVQLTVTSKPERGYALIVGKKASAVGAAQVAISPDASYQTAFQISARACLHQIVANQNPTRSGDSEGVHQARVGLRRLRAAISLFGGMLRDPQSGTIKRELKWITGELGPARDLDVFIKGVVTRATAGKSHHLGAATLTRDLRRRRCEAFGRARSAIESDRFRALVLDIATWIEAGDWTRKADKLARATRDQPIATAAAAEMQRRRKKIMKLGTKMVELDPARRHRMRIQAKKLRYASEFFGITFPGKKAVRRRKEFVATLGQLQDTLGDLNDISVHEKLTERLTDARENDGKRKRGAANEALAAGRLSGREKARIASVLKDAKRAYARFAKAKPFWR
jgi:inorganic triphosphatase YgiF